ncbi:MAG: HIT domain-containing protein [Arenicellales bacterium]|jgi:histidine triad (HIT) family protein|nr:HIT domain-containing protein [Arenicellales bacterium]MDP6948663.1 HIT domain-containing protein [Arenicellales bacterium]
MSEETLFSKIVKGELPADIVFQDKLVTAFRDINPQAPTHILIVPNKIIPTVNDVTEEDEGTLGHMFVVARQLAEAEGIAKDGYRLLVNCGVHGHQEVFHLHMHLVGGQPLGRMLPRRLSEPQS